MGKILGHLPYVMAAGILLEETHDHQQVDDWSCTPTLLRENQPEFH